MELVRADGDVFWRQGRDTGGGDEDLLVREGAGFIQRPVVREHVRQRDGPFGRANHHFLQRRDRPGQRHAVIPPRWRRSGKPFRLRLLVRTSLSELPYGEATA